MTLLPVADALSRILDGADPVASERLPLRQAAGRVLSRPLTALRTQPPFDASAMDGYALIAPDAATIPAPLRVIGTSAAGRGFSGEIGVGETVRIFTGAPLPRGADTVVIQEDTRGLGRDRIEVVDRIIAGRHIRRRGLDFLEGDILLAQGRVLDAAALSLAASANHAALNVVGQPLVAIIATGDELLPPGSEPGADQIIASNGFGVAAIAEANGARVLDLGIAPDDRIELAARLTHAMEAGADVIVTLGGASVGDHDLVRDVLGDQGVTLGFWKIAMRPGKPLMFGRRGAARFLGLPGNPVASLVCAHLFLKPLLAALGGRAMAHDVRPAVLARPMTENDLREDYVRAVVEAKDGILHASPLDIQDSSMLRLLANAHGLIIRKPMALAALAGDPCRVLMLR